MRKTVDSDFTNFVRDAEPRLRRALLGAVGVDSTPDSVAEALAYAWANWDRISSMKNPVGYLYRVGQSSNRAKKLPILPPPDPAVIPDVEPALIDALADLSPRQRRAVWLVHGCGWTYRETAEALEVSTSAVGTHVNRGISRLRKQLGVTANASD